MSQDMVIAGLARKLGLRVRGLRYRVRHGWECVVDEWGRVEATNAAQMCEELREVARELEPEEVGE